MKKKSIKKNLKLLNKKINKFLYNYKVFKKNSKKQKRKILIIEDKYKFWKNN